MKVLLLSHVLVACLFLGCQFRSDREATLRFLPGVYITEYQTEFARTRDTLQVSVLPNTHDLQYVILRRRYHEYRPDSKRPPDYNLERWTASYSERENVLLIHKNGRTLSFDRDRQQLIMGTKRYQKL